jgi:hypothetical protein
MEARKILISNMVSPAPYDTFFSNLKRDWSCLSESPARMEILLRIRIHFQHPEAVDISFGQSYWPAPVYLLIYDVSQSGLYIDPQ